MHSAIFTYGLFHHLVLFDPLELLDAALVPWTDSASAQIASGKAWAKAICFPEGRTWMGYDGMLILTGRGMLRLRQCSPNLRRLGTAMSKGSHGT